MKTQRKHRNIRRIENVTANSYGWWVRVRIEGELFSKFFSDNDYASSLDALRHAMNYRDDIKRERQRPHVATVDPVRHYKGVSRIDTPEKGTHGWYVRVFFKDEQRVKFFSDTQHDGREGALAAALAFRDQAEKELGKPRTDRSIVTTSARNASGHIGVARVVRRERNRKGELYERDVYEVTWCPRPNKTLRTSVSIRKYGEEEALRRAIALRQQKLHEIFGSDDATLHSTTPSDNEMATR